MRASDTAGVFYATRPVTISKAAIDLGCHATVVGDDADGLREALAEQDRAEDKALGTVLGSLT
jgi:hypothetical protein